MEENKKPEDGQISEENKIFTHDAMGDPPPIPTPKPKKKFSFATLVVIIAIIALGLIWAFKACGRFDGV